MKISDRDYFLLRAHQEHEAAAHSSGVARSRHEELESSYQMRVMYIDRGLIDEASDDAERVVSTPPAPVTILA